MILSPVLDLPESPRWGRVEEDFGEDPYLTGELGPPFVRGAQGASLNTDHNVVSEPKHFAGQSRGNVSRELLRMRMDLENDFLFCSAVEKQT
jgi:beta-glucosidase-like glycosyl hydrolase